MAEVSLDHVGIVLGIEMSRLARSNKDWHQLIELCAIFRTLLVQQDFARFRQTRPTGLSAEDRKVILDLSQNLPAVWNAASTSSADRQRIVRLLIERVVVNIHEGTDHCDVTLEWSGGFTSQHELVRPVQRYEQMANYEQLVARIRQLRSQGHSFASVAEHLNREGFRPSKRARRFNSDTVSLFVRRLEKRPPGSKAKAPIGLLQENEWLVNTLAAELEVPKNTLFAWIKRGWIRVSRQLPGYRGRTICWADANELDRLRRLRKTKRGWWDPPLSAELTTPNPMPKPVESPVRKPR